MKRPLAACSLAKEGGKAHTCLTAGKALKAVTCILTLIQNVGSLAREGLR